MTPDNLIPAPRLLLEVPVEFRKSYARQIDNAVLKNISITGAFLKLPLGDFISANDKLNIRFNVSGREREIIATVVWQGTEGCGVQFKPQNNRDVQIVDDLMYFVKNQKNDRKVVLESIFDKVS